MVRDAHDQLHVVLDQQHHDAEARKIGQQMPEPLGVGIVEPGGRLVEQQDARGERERPRDLDQALVDMRQRARERFERPAIAHIGEQAFGQRAAFGVAVGREHRAAPSRPPRSATSTLSITGMLANSCAV